jgi:hypothetical protein
MSVSSDGFPIDRIDGKDAPSADRMCTIPVPPGAVVIHDMDDTIVSARKRVACVNARGAKISVDRLPYHENQNDDKSD